MPRSLRFSSLLTLAFLTGTGIVACHHELWRDEMQAWLIARDSPGWWALCLQGRYDGTPPLWYLLLRPLTLITHRPEAMQVLNWILAGLTFFLICHFSPFSRLQKILLCFNYYLAYEYGVVCRQYLPGILLLSAACILFPVAQRHPWAFAATVAAAAMASVYSLILAVAMAGAFWGPALFRPGTRRHLPALLAVAGAVGAAVYGMLPRSDTFYAPADGWFFHWYPERLARVACAFTNAIFLLPRPEGYFWIPAWLTPFTWLHYLAIALSLPLLAATTLIFRRSVAASVFHGIATAGILLFLYTKYLGFTRHVGFLFIAFLLALWLKRAGSSPESPAAATLRPTSRRLPQFAFTLVLSVQAVTGVWAAGTDLNRSFSCGQEAAAAISAHHLDRAFIAAWPDSTGADLAGYFDRSIYYPRSGRIGSFTRWDRNTNDAMTDEDAWRRSVAQAGQAPLVIALDHELDPAFLREHGLAPLGLFHGSLVPFEDYLIYYRPTAAGPAP
jgi:hypothetical protein